jgi:hypothetical protein
VKRLCLTILFAAGCAAHKPAPPPKRPHTTARKDLPAVLSVPKHGIYAAGGGLMSDPWRVVVDDDAGTIYGGAGTTRGGSSAGKLEKETTNPLSRDAKERLEKLAADAWAEPPPSAPPTPTADYDEILIVADGDDVFYLEGFGPIRQPAAKAAIEELRKTAGL